MKNDNQKQVSIYTDLALEERERFNKNVEIDGVAINKETDKELKMITTTVEIINNKGAKAMGKPKGKYITMESNLLKIEDENIRNKIGDRMAEILKEIHPKAKKEKILVVGLGNAFATPDALGPKVAQEIIIGDNILCIAPGVLAQTGMETYSIIKGIVAEENPDLIIAIDSLAARNVSRVTSTIQIADTGIIPGSGVGNHRMGLNKDTLGKKVIAIGVPMVVSGATIVNDTMEKLLSILASVRKDNPMSNIFSNYTSQEKYELFEELLSEDTEQMFVTPKDVDGIVNNLSKIVAYGINSFCASNNTY